MTSELTLTGTAAALAREHPAFDFARADTHFGDRAWVATARNMRTRPWCLVARDPDEIREALGQRPAPE